MTKPFAGTPWFWDTPEGGGWTRYLPDGESVDRYSLESRIERETDPVRKAELVEILASCPRREPTPAERRAWRKINPPASGQTDQDDGE